MAHETSLRNLFLFGFGISTASLALAYLTDFKILAFFAYIIIIFYGVGGIFGIISAIFSNSPNGESNLENSFKTMIVGVGGLAGYFLYAVVMLVAVM